MSFHCASLAICARATEVAGARLRSMQLTAVTSPLSLPIPSNAAIIAAVGNYDRRDKAFGPHSAGCRNTNNRNVRSPALFVTPRRLVMKPHDGTAGAWSTAGRRGQQSLPEIVTRLTHCRDALSHENRQFALVASMSWLPRLPGAERSDRNRTTRRHPIGGSSLVRAMLLARARSAED